MSALIVPIAVDALVVNDKTRLQNFARWRPLFARMQYYSLVEPNAFDIPTDFSTDAKHNGVYLGWELPAGLRRGAHDLAAGKTAFRHVPNRWLVVRYSGPANGRVATSWIVQSDFLHPDNGTSPYVDPSKRTPTSIGRKTKLGTEPWQDDLSGAPFLTAVGPGLETFASYQPYNEDVFSIHDPLDGVAADDTLSYLVIGWYTAGGGDPLATGDFATTADELGWARDSAATATQSVFCGRVLGIGWHKDGEPPAPPRPDPGHVTLAVGDTSIDALTALVAAQAKSDPTVHPQLLEAFQYGILDRLDKPDGQAELARRAHDAAFRSASAGGYAWQIADDPAPGAKPPNAAELAKEEAWLAALNTAQVSYDQATRKLAADRWQLCAYWWATGVGARSNPKPQDIDLDKVAAQLDPANAEGLANSVTRQAAALAKQVEDGTIPAGRTQADLLSSIARYELKQGLTPGRSLKRVVRPAFRSANDPVVLLTATGSSSLEDPAATVACRFTDEITTGLNWSGGTVQAAAIQGHVPGPDVSGMPEPTKALLVEFFLLDPANATMMANAVGHSDQATIDAIAAAAGAPAQNAVPPKAPAIGFGPWAQPWRPLYLLWQVEYWPIAHDEGGSPAWQFDGTSYAWNGKGAAGKPMTFSGRSLLTPHAVFNLQAQIKRYEQTHAAPDLDAVEQFIASTDKWDVLSQSLDGLGSMLALRDARARMAPPDAIAALVADEDRAVPASGAFPTKVPFRGWPPSPFQPWRSAQIAFSRLTVVDRFGQTIEVVTTQNSKQIQPIVAPAMQPTTKVATEMAVAQLPPRTLQPARLTFDLVDAKRDAGTVGLDVGASPVCAWVVRNYVDRSLLFFGPDGAGLGEMRVVTDPAGARVAWWSATPRSKYASVDGLTGDFPHLARLLSRFTTAAPAGAKDFATLLAVIDATLPLIDPPGGGWEDSMAVLAGRPLVLLRARAQLELDGPAMADPSWQFFFKEPAPAILEYEFPIRLGDLARLGDGLVGYFTADHYDQLNAVHVPEGLTSYAAQIGGASGNYPKLHFGAASGSYFTLLADPRAAVHAVTDALPTATVSLPPRFAAGPLRAIDLTFRAGPLVTTTKPTKAGRALVLPKPSARHGTWTWKDGDGTTWQIAGADQNASMPVDPKVRAGWLDLAGGG